jgi:hypothetical protein
MMVGDARTKLRVSEAADPQFQEIRKGFWTFFVPQRAARHGRDS